MANEYTKKAEQHHREMLSVEAATAVVILRTYQDIAKHLKTKLDALVIEIEAAVARGDSVSEAWKFRRKRLEEIVDQLNAGVRRIGAISRIGVRRGQGKLVKMASTHAEDITTVGAETNFPSVAVMWNRVPEESLLFLVGFAGDGTPLRSVFMKYTDAAQSAIDALLRGVAEGTGPRTTARAIQEVLGGFAYESLRISRTEQLRSYRVASLLNYRANSHIIEGWIRYETLDDRTCVICIEEHGREYSLDELFATHPNCRGKMLPKIKGRENDIVRGPVWFDQQSEELKRHVLGKSAYEAYKTGKVELQDFNERTHSKEWGPGRRRRTVKQAINHAKKRRGTE